MTDRDIKRIGSILIIIGLALLAMRLLPVLAMSAGAVLLAGVILLGIGIALSAWKRRPR
jgi:hypothetical protein